MIIHCILFSPLYPVVIAPAAFVYNVMALFLDAQTTISSIIILQPLDVQVLAALKVVGHSSYISRCAPCQFLSASLSLVRGFKIRRPAAQRH
jgi:hypothetical protein